MVDFVNGLGGFLPDDGSYDARQTPAIGSNSPWQPPMVNQPSQAPEPVKTQAAGPAFNPAGPPRNGLTSFIHNVAGGIIGPQASAQIDQQQAQQQQTRGKQALSLMLQQRALPMEQRGAWAQQNAPVLRSLGADPNGPVESDDELDGHIRGLAGALGMSPVDLQQMRTGITPYQQAQLDAEAAKRNAPYTLNQGDVRMNGDNTVAASNPKPATEQSDFRVATPEEVKAAGLPDGSSAQVDKKNNRIYPIYKPSADDIAPGEMSEEALNNAAAVYNTWGTLPPMGMGKGGQAIRTEIMNRAAKLATGAGVDPNALAAQRGVTKADSGALSKLRAQRTMVSAFEKTFQSNIDVAENYLDKVDNGGMPILNKWINAGRKKLAGDADVSAFHAAVTTVANEYAKIMSGSMGNTAVSDSARQHAEELLNTAQTPAQFREVIKVLRADTGNRMAGFDSEENDIMARMKSGIGKPHSGPPPGAHIASGPDGKKYWAVPGSDKWEPF